MSAKSANEIKLDGLANLLLLQARARNSSPEIELGFTAVNDTLSLVDGSTAILFRVPRDGAMESAELFALSASALPEKNTPFSKWCKSYYRVLLAEYGSESAIVDGALIPSELKSQTAKFVGEYSLWLPLVFNDRTIAVMMLFKAQPWSDGQHRILLQWAATLAHAWNALQGSNTGLIRGVGSISRKKTMTAITIFVAASMLFPVRLSVLAPAELKSSDSYVVRSPIQGVVDQLHVTNNSKVGEGDLLISLDDTALSTELEVAQQELEVARAEFRQASQAAAFSDDASATLQVKRITLEKAVTRVNYLSNLLTRTQIVAPQAATVIIDNSDEFVGRPVQLGERLVLLVDENVLELEMWLPVGDDIELTTLSEVNFFPNVAPNRVYRGELRSLDYEAQLSSLGTLAYRVRASVEIPPEAISRIGMRGTGKLYGRKVSLFYFLFRRPISYIRQLVGF
jgi:multidrug efflux pump subunit AcrA (membrane-fusion protein)